jgi:hypothetical protein
MMPKLYQTVFEPGKGDCFATCVAMILRLRQNEVPNFCAEPDDWWGRFQEWLDEKFALTAVEVNLGSGCLCKVTPGTPCVLTGKSPRGDWLHSTVGVAEVSGFSYYHDPNPAGGFLDGEPTSVLFFASLRPDRYRRHS